MLSRFRLVVFLLSASTVLLSCSNRGRGVDNTVSTPKWVEEAVFYQVFPERFRNGDPSNDPVRESLDFLEYVPLSWKVSEWTKDWYALDSWEQEKSEDVYASMFDRRFGGDIQGVIDQLPYLQDLGITAIWFNPVFAARSLHKYDGSSFHHIDPHFGPDPAGDKAIMAEETHDPATWKWTAADLLFLEMVSQAHDRGIRVILDGVWNHTGRGFFAFEDVRARQASSSYAKWYHIEAFDDPETSEDEFSYAGWFGYEALPEFADTEHGTNLQEEVKAYIMASTSRWMDPDGDGNPEDGIDGWRLDVAQEVPVGFWREWHTHVRRINPHAYTVAEIWTAAPPFVAEAGFTGAMNYHAFSMPVKGYFIDGVRDAQWFVHELGGRLEAWNSINPEAQLNVLDSHDTPRLASMVMNRVSHYEETGNENDYDSGLLGPRSSSEYRIGPLNTVDQALVKMAVLFQMTFVGTPIIYYGTEAGMRGADDPDNRQPMLWPDMVFDPQENGPFGIVSGAEVGYDEHWHRFFKDVISLHREYDALSRGRVQWIEHDWHDMVLAYTKVFGEDSLTILFNRSPEEPRLPRSILDGMKILYSTVEDEGTMEDPLLDGEDWILPAWSGLVLIDESYKAYPDS